MNNQHPNQQPEFHSPGGVTPSGVPIPPPQQPGYNQPPTYSQQPAYGQQPSYGQAHQGYHPVAPNFAQVPLNPARPGIATGASVLGIVTGSLSIIVSLFVYLAIASIQQEAMRTGSDDTGAIIVGYIQLSVTLGIAVVLLIGGINFLKGYGYKTLLVGACIHLGLVTLEFFTVMLVIASEGSTSSSAAVVGILATLIGLGLGISILVCLLNPASKQWRDLISRSR